MDSEPDDHGRSWYELYVALIDINRALTAIINAAGVLGLRPVLHEVTDQILARFAPHPEGYDDEPF